MPPPVLLLIDLLGVRARWHHGGRIAAQRAFLALEEIVVSAIKHKSEVAPIGGLLETDSAALIFTSLTEAVPFARHLFIKTFVAPTSPKHERLWLRGVVVPYRGSHRFRYRARRTELPSNIHVNRLENSLLDAIAAEKSGFRGMRLVVGGGIGTGETMRRVTSKKVRKSGTFPVFLNLRAPSYPRRLQRGRFHDVLWMASDDPQAAAMLHAAMDNRLRWASSDPEEFVQAAATQVIFNHLSALVASRQDTKGRANPALQSTR